MKQETKFKVVRNRSPRPQTIVVKGERITLQGNEEQQMVRELADVFVDRCPGVVVEVTDDFGGVAERPEMEQTIWVANMTGDPDAVETILAKTYDRKNPKQQMENPVKAPQHLRVKGRGGMKEYTAKDGVTEALNLAPFFIDLPPYKRIELPAGKANWFMGMCNDGLPRRLDGPLHKAIHSRRPTMFEPDMSWDLDEMNMYLELCDADAPQGPSLAQVEQEAKDEIKRPARRPTKEEQEEFEEKFAVKMAEKVEAAKRLTMKRIYFRLINPDIRLPTMKEFKEAMLGREIKDVPVESDTTSESEQLHG